MTERRVVGLRVLAGLLVAGFALLTVAVRARPDRSLPGDDAVAGWLGGWRSAGLTRVAKLVTDLGSPWVLVPVGLLALVVLWRRGFARRRLLVMLVTWVGTAELVTLLKMLIGRERPSVGSLGGPPPWDLAFPSGHTTDSAVIYVLLALAVGFGRSRAAARAAMAVAVVLSVLVAVSRVYLGYHWFTDVVGGWLFVGAVLCLAGAELYRPEGDRRAGARTCAGTGARTAVSARPVEPPAMVRSGR